MFVKSKGRYGWVFFTRLTLYLVVHSPFSSIYISNRTPAVISDLTTTIFRNPLGVICRDRPVVTCRNSTQVICLNLLVAYLPTFNYGLIAEKVHSSVVIQTIVNCRNSALVTFIEIHLYLFAEIQVYFCQKSTVINCRNQRVVICRNSIVIIY